MTRYAVRGVKDWNDTDDMVCRGITNCLSTSDIVEKEHLVRRAIQRSMRPDSDTSPKFFPMPDTCRKWKKRRSDRPRASLFVPRLRDGGQWHIAFDLISFMDRQHCLVFRFEPADEPPSSHGYPHVQLSRSLSRRTAPVSCVSRVPDSYPAFPVPARDSMGMFLSMAVAVHGFEGGMKQLIGEMFQERPRKIRRYVETLENLLGIHRPTPESSTGTSDSNARSHP